MKYDGFWSCMDTYKDKQRFEDMVARGQTPWEVWKHPPVDVALKANFEAGMPLVKTRPR